MLPFFIRRSRAGSIEGMKDLDLFRGWHDASIDWVLDNASRQTHIVDSLVVAEGSRPEALYIVSHGLYGASVTQGAVVRQELGRLSAGSVFGEMAWLGGTAASALARAIETSESLVLPLLVLEAKPAGDLAFAAQFNASLARLLAQRLRSTNATLLQHVGVAHAVDLAAHDATDPQIAVAAFRGLVARCDKEQRSAKGMSAGSPLLIRQALNHLIVQLELAVRALDAGNPAAANALGARAQADFLPYLCWPPKPRNGST